MNTRTVLTLCATLVIGGVVYTGLGNELGNANEKTPINDAWLTAKTKIALFTSSAAYGCYGIAACAHALYIRLYVSSARLAEGARQ